MAQDGPQRFGKRQVNARVDLGLAHAGQLVFHRVFHCEDVARARIEPLQGGVQRGRFARARGPGDQHNAMRLIDQAFKAPQCFAFHAHRFQREAAFGLVEQAQHGALAMGTGQGGHAHVNRALAQAQRNAAVLRQALFGDVQAGHDFQARDQGGMQGAVGLHHFAQAAIDPKAHTGMALIGLDVDVTGPIARGLRQQRVQEANDGRVVGGFEQVFHGGQLLHHAAQVGIALHLAHHGGGAGLALGIGIADALGQRGIVHLLVAHEAFAGITPRDLAPGPRGWRRAKPQGQGLAVVLQQELVRAGKGVRQRVAHVYLRCQVGALDGVALGSGVAGAAGVAWPGGGKDTLFSTGNTPVGAFCASCCAPSICW